MGSLLILLLCVGQLLQQASGSCYFTMDYTGTYVTQSIVSGASQVQYLEVAIMPDSIPVWGFCHKKLGNNVLLDDGTNGTMCVRCFHIEVRSPHIIEVHTEGLDKCYTNEAAAIATCPTRANIRARNTREIMLYKKHRLTDNKPLPPVYCPVNGRFHFTYNRDDGTESAMECPQPTSEFANCPRGDSINLVFARCSFDHFEMKFACLGDWDGHDGQRYLALHDPITPEEEKNRLTDRPTFRCAMYKEDPDNGIVHLSLSSDSTCTNNLHSAWNGYETLVLHKVPSLALPHQVEYSTCRFPEWSQGQWEHVKVEGNMLSFTDLTSYKTYQVYCLSPEEDGLMQAYAQSQCGEEIFTCLAIQERSSNVMEFQMSPDVHNDYNNHLCQSNTALSWDAWVTQGRVDRFKQSPCPVAGDYTGVIPDAPVLCAKLSSDCNNPEIMFYTVFSCGNHSDVYEEREYRCLGQWGEGEVTYTYTERRDVTGHECFAGVVIDEGEIYIIEAGTNCQRGLQARSYGMRLVKQVPCLNDDRLPRPTIPSTTHPRFITTKNRTKKPYSPVTKKPSWKDTPKDSSSASINSSWKWMIILLSLMSFQHHKLLGQNR